MDCSILLKCEFISSFQQCGIFCFLFYSINLMIWWQDLYSWNVEKGGNTKQKYKHEIHTSYNLLTTNFCPVLFTPSMATN